MLPKAGLHKFAKYLGASWKF